MDWGDGFVLDLVRSGGDFMRDGGTVSELLETATRQLSCYV